jgi:hypothetical protein
VRWGCGELVWRTEDCEGFELGLGLGVGASGEDRYQSQAGWSGIRGSGKVIIWALFVAASLMR